MMIKMNLLCLILAVLLGCLLFTPWLNISTSVMTVKESYWASSFGIAIGLRQMHRIVDPFTGQPTMYAPESVQILSPNPLGWLIILSAAGLGLLALIGLVIPHRVLAALSLLLGGACATIIFPVPTLVSCGTEDSLFASITISPGYGFTLSMIVVLLYTVAQTVALIWGGNARIPAVVSNLGTAIGRVASNIWSSPQLRQCGKNLDQVLTHLASGVQTALHGVWKAANSSGPAQQVAPEVPGQHSGGGDLAGATAAPALPADPAVPTIEFEDETAPAADPTATPFREIASAYLVWTDDQQDENLKAFFGVMEQQKKNGLGYDTARLRDDLSKMSTEPRAALGKLLYTHYHVKKVANIDKLLSGIVPLAKRGTK